MAALWFGFNAPFIDGGGRILPRQENERLIKNDLLQLLFTVPGERVMSPDFGVNLRNFPFEQLDEESLASIEQEIRDKIIRFEPRVLVDPGPSGVEVKGKPDDHFVEILVRGALTNDPNRSFVFETTMATVVTTTSLEVAPRGNEVEPRQVR